MVDIFLFKVNNNTFLSWALSLDLSIDDRRKFNDFLEKENLTTQ